MILSIAHHRQLQPDRPARGGANCDPREKRRSPGYHSTRPPLSAIWRPSAMRARVLLLMMAATFGVQAHAALLIGVPLQWRATSDLRLGAMEMSQAPVQ